MDIIALGGLLGTVVSIATFFIPETWKSKRITLAVFVFVAVVLCVIITNQNSRLNRIQKISRAANSLIKEHSQYTEEGFVQAALTFMEQQKDVYPDSYQRAVKVYDQYKDGKYANQLATLSFEMKGLIRGIANLNNNDGN